MAIKNFLAVFFIFSLFLNTSCKKNEKDEDEPLLETKVPELITEGVSSIGLTTVSCGGNVISNGGADVISRGLCWSTTANPTTSNSKLTLGAGTGSFNSKIKALQPNTIYHIRAFATNSIGTGYGSNITFTTLQNPAGTVCDADGNIYHTVKIGDQEWTVENLRTSTYNNGDSIPYISYEASWGDTQEGAWCYYNTDTSYLSTYGKMYNWYVVKDSRKVAPVGWHIPNDAEWLQLINHVGGVGVAGGKLKDQITGWDLPNVAATNEYGLSIRGSGLRSYLGLYQHIRTNGYYWSSSELGGNSGKYYRARRTYADFDNSVTQKTSGMAIRCVKD